MESATRTESETKKVIRQLEIQINSLKKIDKKMDQDFKALNVELQTAKNDVQVAREKMEEKDREIKTLKNELLEEKIENEKKAAKINSLTDELRTEKDGTAQQQNIIENLREEVQNEHLALVKEIDGLKVDKKKLSEEKGKITKYLSKLGNEVRFERSGNTDMLDSGVLQRLLEHIQKIMEAQDLAHTRNLEKLRNQIEEMVNANNLRSKRNSSATINDAPTECNIEPTPVISQSSSNPVASSSKASSSSPNQHFIKQITHKLDTSFNPLLGFKCVCGVIVQHKQSFKNHIRRFTEKLKFHCRTCNKAFLHESGLKKHFQSAKCKIAKMQQKKPQMEYKTSLSLASHPKQYLHKSIRHRVGYQKSNTLSLPVHGSSQKGKLKCHQNQCHATFLELIQLKRHLTGVHHIKNPLSKWGTACKSCGKLLEDWNALKQHNKEYIKCASAYNAM